MREDVVYAIHDSQLAEHGGSEGLRDPAALDSALARPRNFAAYERPDVAALAAAYAFGLVRNHPFVDGNKRTAWVVARVFLAINGQRLEFDPHDAVTRMETLAAGTLGESELAKWFQQGLRKW